MCCFWSNLNDERTRISNWYKYLNPLNWYLDLFQIPFSNHLVLPRYLYRSLTFHLQQFFYYIFQYWFQNRRAKSRKLTREVSRVYQTTPSNRFYPFSTDNRLALPRRPQFVADQSGSDHWKHATCVSYRYGPVTQRKDQQYSRLSTPARHQPPVQLNQFSRDVPCPFAMSNSGQSKITHAQLARLARRSSRSSRRFHPY